MPLNGEEFRTIHLNLQYILHSLKAKIWLELVSFDIFFVYLNKSRQLNDLIVRRDRSGKALSCKL